MAKKKVTKKTTKKKTANINSTMTLNAYLSTYSRHRNIDKVIVKWFMKKDNSNPSKPKKMWDKIIKSFWNETER